MRSPVIVSVARIALPVAIAVAAALLVKGYTGAGDGFAAGGLIAIALGLQLVAGGAEQADRLWLVRHAGRVTQAGLALALLIAFAPVAFGAPPMTHVPSPGAEVTKVGSLELTTALAFDAAVLTLVVGAFGAMLGAIVRNADPEGR